MKRPLHRIKWELTSKWGRLLTAYERKRRERICSAPQIQRKARALGDRFLPAWNRVSLNIHPRDNMFTGDLHHYLTAGEEAAHLVHGAISAEASKTPCILDFPCGYGRVTRHLRASFPYAAIHGAELETSAVDFCRINFDLKPEHTALDLSRLDFTTDFDIIWCGSLMTHLDETATRELLRSLYRFLKPGGSLLITAHGDLPAQRICEGDSYGLNPDLSLKLLDPYARNEFAYADYPDLEGYGISLTPRSWMISFTENELSKASLRFIPAGWDAHQDVYLIHKREA